MSDARLRSIVVVGSGTVENVIASDADIQVGSKYLADRHELFGGSGLNYAFRLAMMGHAAFPIISLGNDSAGRKFQKNLTNIVAKKIGDTPVSEFISDGSFLCESLSTPQSTILVTKGERTIFSQKIENITAFEDYMSERFKAVTQYKTVDVGAVMIGHIYADNREINPENSADVTRSIIRKFRNRSLIYANFGSSQIDYGSGFWKNSLKNIDVFQMTLTEVRSFFRDDPRVNSISDIIHWFRKRGQTVIITLDRFGAIANYMNGNDGVIFAWPFEIGKLVDSTGAGDAFGAGLMASLYKKDAFSFGDFIEAIKNARLWAAYACTKLGGANECPDRKTLRDFEKEAIKNEFYPIEIKNISDSDLILRLLDKVY